MMAVGLWVEQKRRSCRRMGTPDGEFEGDQGETNEGSLLVQGWTTRVPDLLELRGRVSLSTETKIFDQVWGVQIQTMARWVRLSI
jgi:hypothetical protein